MIDKTACTAAYQGGDGRTVFPIPFPFLEPSHIHARIRDASGRDTALAQGTDFQVQRVSDSHGELTLAGPGLPAGSTLTISRRLPLTQEILFHNQGPNSPKAMEEATDKLTMIAQQLQADLDDRPAPTPNDDRLDRLEAAIHAKAPACHRHNAAEVDGLTAQAVGALPTPPATGKSYLGTATGWTEYHAPEAGGSGESASPDPAALAAAMPLMAATQKGVARLAADGGLELDAGGALRLKADQLLSKTTVDTRLSDLEANIGDLGPLARAADAPRDGTPYQRRDGGWEPAPEPAATPPGGGALLGEIRLLPFRAAALPAGWYFCNGDRLPLASPQGAALDSLPAEFKSDWNITAADGAISLPNLFTTTGGAFLRPVDNTTRLPGTIQTDAIRNITARYEYAATIGSVVNGGTYGASTLEGAFHPGEFVKSSGPTKGPTGGKTADLHFDASRSVPVADEVRPINIGMTPAIYLGV